MTRAGVTVTAVIGVALLGVPGAAHADCAQIIPEPDPFAESDVVAEGVLLSTPSRNGRLFSPTRLAVSRYLKGSGPRVLSVETTARQMAPGFRLSFDSPIEDTYYVRPGQTWRLHFDRGWTPYLGDGCAYRHEQIPRSRVLRRLPGVVRARRGWRAWQLKGPGRVRCVRVGRGSGGGSERLSCARRGAALAMAHRLSREHPQTAIAIASPGLRRVTIGRRGARAVTASVRPGRPILAVFEGRLGLGDISIEGTLAGGAKRQLGGAHRRALTTDGGWAADFETPYGHGPLPYGCVTVDDLNEPDLTNRADGSRVGYCGRRALFFAVRQAGSDQTLVFGGADRAIVSVTIESPTGTRHAGLSPDGRAFIAALPAKVASKAVTLRVLLRSGVEMDFAGRRSLNLSPKPR